MEKPFTVPDGVRIRNEYATDEEHVFSKRGGHIVVSHPATRIVATGENMRVADELVPDVRSTFVPDRLKPFLTDLRRKRVAARLGKLITKSQRT